MREPLPHLLEVLLLVLLLRLCVGQLLGGGQPGRVKGIVCTGRHGHGADYYGGGRGRGEEGGGGGGEGLPGAGHQLHHLLGWLGGRLDHHQPLVGLLAGGDQAGGLLHHHLPRHWRLLEERGVRWL